MRTIPLLVLCVFSFAQSAAARGEAEPPTKTLSPYFVVQGNEEGVESFPLKDTQVVANVTGVIADVTVTQLYTNQGTTPISARYVFPASTRAAVHGMRIRIGDNVVVAKIKERQQAKQEYVEAEAAGKTASLLEQQRPNVFSMSVANIMPNDQVQVELRYSELLVPTDGTYEFVYPTAVGPRYSNKAEPTGVEDDDHDQWVKSPYLHQGVAAKNQVNIAVNLSTGVPLAALRSPSHEPKIAWDEPSLAHVTVQNDPGNKDFILNFRLRGKEIQSGLLLYEGARENFFLLTVQPPERVAPAQIPAREYIFVLDVSGSMHGFPLNTAKVLMQNLISNLRPTDTFNVLLFSGGSKLLSPKSLPATQANLDAAVRVITRESGGGGTELAAALGTAVALPRIQHVSRSIVVVTDGYIAEEKEAFSLIHKNLQTTNFFAFGIGSGVNRYLIEGIAHAGVGEPFVITGPAQADEVAERFRRYIQSPVLTNIRVSYQGFDAYDVEPQVQPDLFAERPVVLFGKWRGPKKGSITIFGQGAVAAFSKTFDVGQTEAHPEHAALPQLWARSRIARLSDFSFLQNDPESIREVTTLGLTYSLLTAHTSFVAVMEQIRNPSGKSTNVAQPLPLPEGVSDLAIDGYASGAEPGVVLMLAFLLATALALHLRKRSC